MKKKMTKKQKLFSAASILIMLALISFISFKIVDNHNPYIKYELRCEDVSSRYQKEINTLKYKDELTFCEADIKEPVNGFYINHSSHIYLNSNNVHYLRTIYHEYSHHLLDGKIDEELLAEMYTFTGYNNEELTDFTAFFLLLGKEYSPLLSDFSYIEFNEHFTNILFSKESNITWEYLDEVYKVEGLDDKIPLRQWGKHVKFIYSMKETSRLISSQRIKNL